MKLNKSLLIFSLAILLLIGAGACYAEDTSDISLNNASVDDNILTVNDADEETAHDAGQLDELEENNITGPKTIIVKPDSKIPNQVLAPTVQPAIDEANPGDTIVLQGQFVHCHFQVTKPLTIKPYSSSTTISPCPHHHNPVDSDYYGIFYISPEASGTVIEGFDFGNTDYTIADGPQNPFAIFIDGADNITIKDCTVNWNVNESFLYDGIIVKNSRNALFENVYLNNTKRGFAIINSSNLVISDSKLENSRTSVINVYENSEHIKIISNEISGSKFSGINLSSGRGIQILNNVIKSNGFSDEDCGSGIYINSNVSDSAIKGNLIINNFLHAVMFDYRLRNMGTSNGDENLLVVDNNYFAGHKDMVVHRRIFEKSTNGGYAYDETKDIYYKQSGGGYIPSKAIFYMRNAFVGDELVCGFTYYNPTTPWAKGDYSLIVSFSQISKGVYNVSLTDSKGNPASDLSSFDVVFYLNDLSDLNKTVHIKNGSAIADFSREGNYYLENNNVLCAVFPNDNVFTFNISDSDVPVYEISTFISPSNLTTYPLSDDYFKVKLTDSYGNVLASKEIAFTIGGDTFTAKTDDGGIAKVKVSLTSKKTYSVDISYAGDGNYSSSNATGTVVVKTGSKKAKITASNMKVKRNTKKTFKLKLAAGTGKALKSQKVIVKVNGKSYTLKTSSKGIAKLPVKLSKAKKYGVSIKFLGNEKYKPVSKTVKITVTKK